MWACLDSNQGPLPYQRSKALLQQLAEACKSPAKRRVLRVKAFPIFLQISLGCCTVAAPSNQREEIRWHPAHGYTHCENLRFQKSANDALRGTLHSKAYTDGSTEEFSSGWPLPLPCERRRTETPQLFDVCSQH